MSGWIRCCGLSQNTDKKRFFFGIRRKMGVAIGLIVIVISAISFALAVYLHIALSLDSAIQANLYSGRMIMEELDPKLLTVLFQQGREIYDSIPEDIRKDRNSKEYLSRFEVIKTGDYEKVRKQLIHLAKFENLKWVDLRISDPDKGRWIYLMHTNEEDYGNDTVGYWVSGDETLSTFRDSTDEEQAEENSYWGPIRMIMSLTYMDLWHMDRFATTTEFCDPKTGAVIGFVGTGEKFDDYREEMSIFWTLHFIALFFSLIVVFAVSDYLINYWMVKPILNLASVAEGYFDDREKMINTHHFDRVQIHTHDELRLLQDSMVEMEEDLTRYMKDIAVLAAEKERVAVEMELSAKIQTSLLPKKLEKDSGEQSFSISALIDPARDVGGDFYDYYTIDDDHIVVTIADVSDKGVPAALFMMMTKTLLRTAGMMEGSPAQIMKKVNRQLYEQNPEMMFVTVFFGIYTISEKKLAYVNAGHEDMALYRDRATHFDMIKEEHDIVMGISSDAKFVEREIHLEEGDKLFLYTDGVPEANNMRNEMFGEKRMMACLNEWRQLRGEALLQKIRERVGEFVGEREQFDDVTMLLLEVGASVNRGGDERGITF